MIDLKNISKKIGKNMVLKNVTYQFEDGKIYGLYGRNGAGKTMLLRIISGLLIPSEGIVKIDGEILHKDISFPKSVGIVIENMELLPKYSAYENLKMLSMIKKEVGKTEIEEALKKVGLDQYQDLKVKKYSLGMKQRLNIAQAVFEKNDIILLDEPTNALDSEGVQLVYQLLKEEKDRGAIVIIATHHKEDLQRLSDIVIELEDGQIIRSDII